MLNLILQIVHLAGSINGRCSLNVLQTRFHPGGTEDTEKRKQKTLRDSGAQIHPSRYLSSGQLRAQASMSTLTTGYCTVTECGCSSPTSLTTFSSLARFSGRIGHIGSRYASSIRPIIDSTAFTGIGFDSMKFACIKGRYLRKIIRATSHLPPRAACVIRVISAGIAFEATDTIPTPPSPITASVIASSPEKTRKSSGSEPHTS